MPLRSLLLNGLPCGLLLAAGQAGAARCLTGIGGSATNDGGFGMAQVLGWVFRDESGKAIEQWPGLDGLAGADLTIVDYENQTASQQAARVPGQDALAHLLRPP